MKINHLQVVEWWATLMDNQFSIGKFSFGLDPIINVVPILGPTIGFALSLYILWIARDLEVPSEMQSKMLRNIIFDYVFGAIPVLGTVGDFVFKANARNLKMLKDWVASRPMEGEVVSSRRV